MEKRNCYVKVIVNPQATKSFALRFELYPKKEVNLKIMVPNINDITSIMEEIKHQLPMKYNFNVQFNWKNVPQSIKDDKKFQEEILKIFSAGVSNVNVLPSIQLHTTNQGVMNQLHVMGTKNTDSNTIPLNSNIEYERLAAIVKLHKDQHGAAPDFRNNFNEKNKLKIHNYIKTILGMPNLSPEQTIFIANLVIKDSV